MVSSKRISEHESMSLAASKYKLLIITNNRDTTYTGINFEPDTEFQIITEQDNNRLLRLAVLVMVCVSKSNLCI